MSVSLFNIAIRLVRRCVFLVAHYAAPRRVVAAQAVAGSFATVPQLTRAASLTAAWKEPVKVAVDKVLREYPHVRGTCGRTPSDALNLQPGESVQVKSKGEIESTLDSNNKNRGLLFDVEMVPYCGGTYRVLRRVNRIIDERTGKMLVFSDPCIILDGVVCTGCVSRDRLFCPRSIYWSWREVWLRRAE